MACPNCERFRKALLGCREDAEAIEDATHHPTARAFARHIVAQVSAVTAPTPQERGEVALFDEVPE